MKPSEVDHFINKGNPESQVQPEITVDKTALVTAAQPASDVSSEAKSPVKPKSRKEKIAEIINLISLHVRIPLDVSQALLKASSERKLQRIIPFTQTAIMQEAFTEWLQKHGYWQKAE